jgi:phage shock protein C
MAEKKLMRAKNGKLFGVCGGLANYLGVDPTILRIIWVLLVLCAGVGILAYLICALIMPKED